jgi:hypothetical protein
MFAAITSGCGASRRDERYSASGNRPSGIFALAGSRRVGDAAALRKTAPDAGQATSATADDVFLESVNLEGNSLDEGSRVRNFLNLISTCLRIGNERS